MTVFPHLTAQFSLLLYGVQSLPDIEIHGWEIQATWDWPLRRQQSFMITLIKYARLTNPHINQEPARMDNSHHCLMINNHPVSKPQVISSSK